MAYPRWDRGWGVADHDNYAVYLATICRRRPSDAFRVIGDLTTCTAARMRALHIVYLGRDAVQPRD